MISQHREALSPVEEEFKALSLVDKALLAKLDIGKGYLETLLVIARRLERLEKNANLPD